MKNKKPWQNSEGYPDPTAYAAMKSIEREESAQQRRVTALVHVLRYIIDLAGFELLNRIEIRDKTTGREYR